MAFYRDIRVLVAIVCGLLTTVSLGLGIWRTVVWITIVTPQRSPPIEFCKNGGTWSNGRCNCPELWKGLRCTIVNFCENSTDQSFTFPRIPAGQYGYSEELCDSNTTSAGKPRATRLCNITENGRITLTDATVGSCNESLKTLEAQLGNGTQNYEDISTEVQMLTSNANELTPENIDDAATIVRKIFSSEDNSTHKAKEVAVTTVSQLLDASEDAFQRAVQSGNNTPVDNTFNTLIQQIEEYSMSLHSGSVVQPNVAVQSVQVDNETSTSVRFSVLRGSSASLNSGSMLVDTNVDHLETSEVTEIQILLNTSESNSGDCGFVVYQNSKLFQSKKFTTSTDFSQKVISGSSRNHSASVEMAFNTKYKPAGYQLHSYACAYWNFSQSDWDTKGCDKVNGSGGFLLCRCNHTTNFAVLMSFQKNYKYPDSLDKLSTAGCALSITGLVLTIVFQIVTRKGRKTSVTWVLVSLCTSMLIFNLLFVFGIENSNKNLATSDNNDMQSQENVLPSSDENNKPNPTCTAVAGLLHYFVLATFTWTGLSAAQLYFLLIRTMKPLPQRFILYISLIGWGVPAVVVAMTVGIIYAKNKNHDWELHYRQEEICWLAILDGKERIESPWLWSFIVPVSIILICNVVIFIVITVKVLWKDNQNLTSTKKVSSIKKVLSTLSIAVVFGITWILAYLMLTDDQSARTVFSYVFCLFNTTQGLQIFVLHTVRNKIFQNEASKVWKSLSSSTKSMNFRGPSVTRLRLRLRMYNMLRALPALNERFRLLEPSTTTEETEFSGSFQENSSN